MDTIANRSRRRFLKSSAALGGVLVVGFFLPEGRGRFAQAADASKPVAPASFGDAAPNVFSTSERAEPESFGARSGTAVTGRAWSTTSASGSRRPRASAHSTSWWAP